MKITTLLLIVSSWTVLVLSEDQYDPSCSGVYSDTEYCESDAKDDQNYQDYSDIYPDDRGDSNIYPNDRGDSVTNADNNGNTDKYAENNGNTDKYADNNGNNDKYADTCNYGDSDTYDDRYDYRNNIDDDIYNAVSTFAVNILFKLNAKYSNDMFVISPNGIYMELAAMAEGATGEAQLELFRVLGLPENNRALREKYYVRIMSSRPPENGSYIATKILAVDESFCVNEAWAEYVRSRGILDYALSLPLRGDPNAALEILNVITYNRLGQDINLDGNFLSNTVDQSIVWQTEFPLSGIEENAIFYNEMGQPIGTVTLMYARKRVMIAPLEKYESRALVLPIGEDGRYVMMFVLNFCDPLMQTAYELDTTINKEILNNATETDGPIYIAIPKFTMESSDMSMRYILEQMGVRKLWYDPNGSDMVSDPPAVPTALYQRIRFRVDSQGVFPYCEDDSSEDGCEESADNFIINRPFLYAVVDVVTKLTVTSGAFNFSV